MSPINKNISLDLEVKMKIFNCQKGRVNSIPEKEIIEQVSHTSTTSVWFGNLTHFTECRKKGCRLAFSGAKVLNPKQQKGLQSQNKTYCGRCRRMHAKNKLEDDQSHCEAIPPIAGLRTKPNPKAMPTKAIPLDRHGHISDRIATEIFPRHAPNNTRKQ